MKLEISTGIISSEELCRRVYSRMESKGIQSNKIELQHIQGVCEVNWNIVNESLNLLMDNIRQINETWMLNDQYIISNRKYIGKLIVLIKRCIRKLVWWLINPYVRQQIAFNGAATRAICDMQKIQLQLMNGLKQISEGSEKND